MERTESESDEWSHRLDRRSASPRCVQIHLDGRGESAIERHLLVQELDLPEKLGTIAEIPILKPSVDPKQTISPGHRDAQYARGVIGASFASNGRVGQH